MKSIFDYLKDRAYPGRGIVIGRDESGENAVFAYFIMGRSAGSRNRVFAENSHGGIETKPADINAVVGDPSLTIYNAVRIAGNKTIITNGTQTDIAAELMDKQYSFEQSLRSQEYEPDAPLFTPRISSVARFSEDGLNYAMSIIKKGAEGEILRYNFAYNNPASGIGRILHTYDETGGNPVSFSGEPAAVSLKDSGDLKNFADNLWNSLNADNKVSLFVRKANIASGKAESIIINKN